MACHWKFNWDVIHKCNRNYIIYLLTVQVKVLYPWQMTLIVRRVSSPEYIAYICRPRLLTIKCHMKINLNESWLSKTLDSGIVNDSESELNFCFLP